MDYKKYSDAFFEYIPPKDELRSRFDESFEDWIDNAPNVFDDIQYEATYGERDFEYIKGRVDSVINPTTGQKLGDDFKNFIFSNSSSPVFTGKLFKWKENYWIAVNANTYESVSNNCVVRRCNNMLKWIDKTGSIISEPCIMIETVKQSNDYTGDKLTTVSGFTGLFCQRNANTNMIVSNQRFLFGTKGNRKAFKIFGDGIKNFLNSETENDNSPSVTELTIGGAFVYPDIDDLENGIANRFLDNFTLKINDVDFTDLVGVEKQLEAIVKKEDIVMESPLTWNSSDNKVVFVDDYGNIKLLKSGEAYITCGLENNDIVSDSIKITVALSKADCYEVMVDPDIDGIKEGNRQLFTVNLYKNDIKQEDSFIFTEVSDIPSNNYSFTIVDDNSFIVENKKAYFVDPISIECVSGEYSRTVVIDLKGGW